MGWQDVTICYYYVGVRAVPSGSDLHLETLRACRLLCIGNSLHDSDVQFSCNNFYQIIELHLY